MEWGSTLASLTRRGFIVNTFDTVNAAKAYLLEALRPCARVGIGGSVTVRDMGLSEALHAQGNTIHWHWEGEASSHAEAQRLALSADAYVCSINALVHDGRIVQIDGTGNRLAALCFGPPKVFLVAGRNKLVSSGGLLAGIARIKREACPKNARRLNLDTPCARAGTCDEDRCGHTLCRLSLVLESPPKGRQIEVVLIDEDLGY